MKAAVLYLLLFAALAARAGMPVELRSAGFHQTDGKGGAVGWSAHPNWHADVAGRLVEGFSRFFGRSMCAGHGYMV